MSRSQKVMKNNKKINSSLFSSQKYAICISCPQSKQSSDERKRGAKICRKSNRLVNNVIKDPKFTCPIDNWKGIR